MASKEPKGALKFPWKTYLLYDGVNTIGRNLQAVVNIKNKNVSQNHAVFMITPENKRYISDLKSSNGTLVNKIKIQPLELQEIHDSDTIDFSDVSCIFQVVEDPTHITQASQLSQSFAPSFYSTQTQQIVQESPNIHEASTQIFDMRGVLSKPPPVSIHDQPTQIFCLQNHPAVGGPDLETEVSEEIHENLSNDSIDLMTMDTVETQRCGHAEIISFDTSAQGDIATSQDSVSSDHCYDKPVQNSQHNKCRDNGDSILSTPPCSQIKPVAISGSKRANPFHSDSEEDSITKPKRRSKYIISDSETDIEDNDETDVGTTTNGKKEKSVVDEVAVNSVILDDSEVIPATQDFSRGNCSESFRLPLSEPKPQNSPTLNNYSLPKAEILNLEKHSQETEGATIERDLFMTDPAPHETKNSEDILLPDTETLHIDGHVLNKEKLLQSEDVQEPVMEPQPSTSKEPDDDFYLQATQKSQPPEDSFKIPAPRSTNSKTEEDIYFEATQKLISDPLISTAQEDENDLIRPTQSLERLHFGQDPREKLSNDVEDQLNVMFGSQKDAFNETQQLVDILENSFKDDDDVVEDSVLSVTNRKSLLMVKQKSSSEPEMLCTQTLLAGLEEVDTNMKSRSEDFVATVKSPEKMAKMSTKLEIPTLQSSMVASTPKPLKTRKVNTSISPLNHTPEVQNAKKIENEKAATSSTTKSEILAENSSNKRKKTVEKPTVEARTRTRQKNPPKSKTAKEIEEIPKATRKSKRTAASSTTEDSKSPPEKPKTVSSSDTKRVSSRTRGAKKPPAHEEQLEDSDDEFEASPSSISQSQKSDDGEIALKKKAPGRPRKIAPKTSSREIKATDAEDKIEDNMDEDHNKASTSAQTNKLKTDVPKIKTRASKRRGAAKAKEDEEDISSVASDCSSNTSAKPAKRGRKLSANSRRLKSEQVVQESSLQTPERGKRKLKPKVVFTMLDDSNLESIVRQLGGSLVDTVDSCTVLVTNSVKRSQKLLCAVGQAKPICSAEWLKASKKSFNFLDPWEHLLEDEEAQDKWNFKLKDSLIRSSQEKLFQGYTFQIITNAAQDVLKGAIESCGGKCVTRNLHKCTTDHLIVISTRENKAKFEKIVSQNKKIKVVEPEAIYDATLRQEIRFNKHIVKY